MAWANASMAELTCAESERVQRGAIDSWAMKLDD